MKLILIVFTVCSMLFPAASYAIERDVLLDRIDELSQKVERLTKEIETKEAVQDETIVTHEKKIKDAAYNADKAVDISRFNLKGDYRFRVDSIKAKFPAQSTLMGFSSGDSFTAKNDSIMTHRFRLNIEAKATENIGFMGRLAMYKVAGSQTSSSLSSSDSMFGNGTFFDGNTGHIAKDNVLRVDQAFVNWMNVGGLPVAFSVGRRPSTAGPPSHLRQNTERDGQPLSLGIDYAFDGMVVALFHDKPAPGNLKICYGRGFEAGFEDTTSSSVDDVDFAGFNWELNTGKDGFFQLQGFKAFSLMDVPEIEASVNQRAMSSTNVGDLYQLTTLFMHKIKNVDWFVSGGMSRTDPKKQSDAGFGSILTDPGTSDFDEKDGYAFYAGLRVPLQKLSSKVGFEYNYGSKNWITLTPAADDLIASKLATRGSVYEAYWIYEIPGKKLSRFAKTFIRLGYQYYDYEYSGSGQWLGEPKKISDINTTSVKPLFPAAKNMQDIYASFDVYF